MSPREPVTSPRLAQLYRELAGVTAEQARLQGEIAAELGDTPTPAPEQEPRRRRAEYRPPMRPVSETDKQAARRALERRGYAVREER